jgi:hypothetical protein
VRRLSPPVTPPLGDTDTRVRQTTDVSR